MNPVTTLSTGRTTVAGLHREFRIRPILVILLCLLTAALSPAWSQVPVGNDEGPAGVEIPENLTREQARDLVARLSDAEVRELIITQLDRQASKQQKGNDSTAYMGQLREGFRIAVDSIEGMFRSGNEIGALPGVFWRQLTDNGRSSAATLLLQLVGLLLAGWAAEHLVRRLLRKADVNPDSIPSLGRRFNFAIFGMLAGLVELLAYAGGAALFISIACRNAPTANFFWYEFLFSILLIKLVWLAVAQLVSPRSAGKRLVSVSDAAATSILAWSILLSGVVFLPNAPLAMMTEFGAQKDAVLLLNFAAGALFIGLILVLLIRLRGYVASLILRDGGNNGPIRQALARSWWALASFYVLFVWLLAIGRRAATGESSLVPGLSSLILLVMIPFLDRGLKWVIAWYFSAKEESAEGPGANVSETAAAEMQDASGSDIAATGSASAAAENAPVYIRIALRYARIIMVLCIFAIFLRLWDIDIRALSAQLLGPRFASALFDISITVLLTWALWGMIRISIERKLDEDRPAGDEAEGESEAGGLGGSRVGTVLPLIRIFIKITLIVMAVLISLSALGVNIGPLIAGAGVVGIAIGFGAQTLVRDIVSGFFYLLDDAFRIGEYVVIDQIRGTVEKISIRSFQLRHHNGPVHTIPYGEIRSLTNWSRDWAIMKFELRIPFETDIDQVRKIIKQIGIDMMEDPAFGPLMLAPLKSQGVNRMDDSALIIRCKFTAVPGQQYLIRREAFTRIQRVFEEKGIHFAPRRVLVEATTPGEAVKAAAGAIDSEQEQSKGNESPQNKL